MASATVHETNDVAEVTAPTLLGNEEAAATDAAGKKVVAVAQAVAPAQVPDPKVYQPVARTEDEDDGREPSYLMQFLLCATAALEGADTALLPAAMLALQEDVGLKITDLAYLNTAQAVCTNIAAPFWGILADRGILERKTILIIGSLGQGAVTCMLAVITILGPMIFLRALNGALLAALRPISNGIIADMTAESKRGKLFGRVQSSLMFGMFITSLVVVPIARKEILGIQGWRVAFVLIGAVSLVVSALLYLLMKEPPRAEAPTPSGEGGICRAVWDEVKSLLQFFRIPTFCVMILQGIFGTIPWSVMGNMALYLQLSGMADGPVGVLGSINSVAGMAGNILAGYVADFLASRLGYNGRPLSAQITVMLGLPCIYLLFYGIPPGDGSFGIYLTLILTFGLLGSWAQSGTNFPILSEIVPSHARSRVMAWECALENSIANALGPVVVALLATEAFGYDFDKKPSGDSIATDLHSARALGTAMTCVICVPWLVCFCAYSILHWSYPRDMKREALRVASEQHAAQKVEEA